jgi:hypothetical protein
MKWGFNEPKKLIILSALVAVGGYLEFSDMLSSPSRTPAGTSAVAPVSPAPAPGDGPIQRATPRPSRSRGQSDEFHPVLHSKRPEDRIDPAKVDPTLRLDLLAKVQQSNSPGPGRNIFQFGQPPVKPLPPEPKIDLTKAPLKPPGPVAPPTPAGPPPPPPINLRYYGFTAAAGNASRTAFFLDGEDILVAREGETLKRRYRVVRIGTNSVVMEDTESKHQQTLPLVEEAAG